MLYCTYHWSSSNSDEPRIEESLVKSFGDRYTATEPKSFLRLHIGWWRIRYCVSGEGRDSNHGSVWGPDDTADDT